MALSVEVAPTGGLAGIAERHGSASFRLTVWQNLLISGDGPGTVAGGPEAAYDDAVRRLRAHLGEHRTLTVAAARDVLGSSRRYVLPLLEWLDAQKIIVTTLAHRRSSQPCGPGLSLHSFSGR